MPLWPSGDGCLCSVFFFSFLFPSFFRLVPYFWGFKLVRLASVGAPSGVESDKEASDGRLRSVLFSFFWCHSFLWDFPLSLSLCLILVWIGLLVARHPFSATLSRRSSISCAAKRFLLFPVFISLLVLTPFLLVYSVCFLLALFVLFSSPSGRYVHLPARRRQVFLDVLHVEELV